MMHAPTCDKLHYEFLELYKKDFEITGRGLMETFLGMDMEQLCKVIRPHLHSNIQEVLTEYKAYIKKALRQNKVPMSAGLILTNENCPITSYQQRQKNNRSFIAKLQFTASWIRFDTSFAVSLATRALFCASAGP